jgi:hypothetical protein
MKSRPERVASSVSRDLTEASRFRSIVIIDSGDPDHAGGDGAGRLPLTVFNRG